MGGRGSNYGKYRNLDDGDVKEMLRRAISTQARDAAFAEKYGNNKLQGLRDIAAKKKENADALVGEIKIIKAEIRRRERSRKV